jgi:hypothetical protein
MKEWLLEFKKAHDRYKSGELTGADRKAYLDAREQLAAALMKAQGMQRPASEPARSAFRVAQAAQVEVRIGEEKITSLTLDVARGGFSALLAVKLDPEQVVSFTLKLPGGDTLSGKVKVVAAKRQGATSRYSLTFANVEENDLDKLETVLFDWALAKIQL